MGTESFPGVKSGRGVTLIRQLFLVLWSWKCRAIPLLPLWVVRPVQSLSAVQGWTLPFFVQLPSSDLCSLSYFIPLTLNKYWNWNTLQITIEVESSLNSVPWCRHTPLARARI